uniref:DinB family protein n=1 Tax=Ningiella ruwaisensis TaxID=2364274 RepID=UPI00109F5008|nr:DinB family protein [Ningiella ruwaisensis]
MSNSYTAIIEQAISLLDELSDAEYQQIIKPHFSSSIGVHMRHIIDHFLSLKNGALSKTTHIDYNIRNRHNEVEQYPKMAVQVLNEIKQWIGTLTSDNYGQNVLVTTEIDIHQSKSASCASTLERELVFVCSHAIHHFALIRIMCATLNKQIPEYFGYAPATITHLNRSA